MRHAREGDTAGEHPGGDLQRAAVVQIPQEPRQGPEEYVADGREAGPAAGRGQGGAPPEAAGLQEHDRDPATRQDHGRIRGLDQERPLRAADQTPVLIRADRAFRRPFCATAILVGRVKALD